MTLHDVRYSTCQVFDDVVVCDSSVGGDGGGGGMGALCDKQTTHKRECKRATRECVSHACRFRDTPLVHARVT